MLDSVFILLSYFYLASKLAFRALFLLEHFCVWKNRLSQYLNEEALCVIKILLNHTVVIALFNLLFFYSRERETRRRIMKIPINEKSQILIDWNRLNVSFSSIDPFRSSHSIPHNIKTLPQETNKDPPPKNPLILLVF